jgi:glyoxylase-like metal-dependent hydrolase (beta-lactamase superfamily II)
MQQIRDGLWRWTAPHPDWKPEQDWAREVGCLALAGDGELVLIDPLGARDGALAEALDGLADGRRLAVVVTVHWHERDAAGFRDRYGAELWVREGSVERVGTAVDRTFGDGDRLPGGIRALDVGAASEALMWIPSCATLAAGDVLVEREGRLRLCPVSWYDRAEDFEHGRRAMMRALELPVAATVVSHGDPAVFEGRSALEAALRGSAAP